MTADSLGPSYKLIRCMEKGHLDELAKCLKKAHDDIDSEIHFKEDTEKMTALHYATKMGFVKAVEKLLDLGADAHRPSPFDRNTPLHLACNCENAEDSMKMVELLLQRGVDVGAETYCGRTPLIMASEANHPEVVDILCCQGAFTDHQYGEEEYPPTVSKAIQWNQQHNQQLDLEEVGDPYVGNTAFIQACREHHIAVVETLIQHGCDLDLPNAMGNTPLHVACCSYCRSALEYEPQRFPVTGNKEIVGMLLQQQCCVDLVNGRGETPVLRAIFGIAMIDGLTMAYSREEKASQMQTLLEIVLIMVNAGCDVTAAASDLGQSTLTALLRNYKIIRTYDSDIVLLSKLTKCLKLILAAGCPVLPADLQMLKELEPPSLAQTLTEFVDSHCDTPSTLKQLSKFRIRQLTHKPLSHFLPKTPLPQHLQRYLLLQVED